MNDLEQLACEVMQGVDPTLVDNFVKIVLFSRDNSEFQVLGRGSRKLEFGSRGHLQWLAEKYVQGREPKALPTPGTVPDPALATVPDARTALMAKELDAEVRADEQTRILGGLLRLPITHTQAWDQGGYSVSITDAISVVRGKQP